MVTIHYRERLPQKINVPKRAFIDVLGTEAEYSGIGTRPVVGLIDIGFITFEQWRTDRGQGGKLPPPPWVARLTGSLYHKKKSVMSFYFDGHFS